MNFRIISQPISHTAQSPVRVVEQATGRGLGWVNRYLDREYLRRLADTTLRTYALNLLHFVRWWESLHHTGDVVEGDLTESTLLDYVKFQSSQQRMWERRAWRTGLDGVIDSLRAAHHALEMFRRALPMGAARSCLDRLSNRLTKIATEARKLRTP